MYVYHGRSMTGHMKKYRSTQIDHYQVVKHQRARNKQTNIQTYKSSIYVRERRQADRARNRRKTYVYIHTYVEANAKYIYAVLSYMLDCYVQEMMFMIIVICVTRMFDALVHKLSCTRTIMYVHIRTRTGAGVYRVNF